LVPLANPFLRDEMMNFKHQPGTGGMIVERINYVLVKREPGTGDIAYAFTISPVPG
jgi:hypothetical protein